MIFSLETTRLRLRELEPNDLGFVSAMLGDERVMRYYPKVLSRQEASAWLDRQLERYQAHGHGLWLALLLSTGEAVGQVGLLRQEVEGVVEPEIGYLLHAPYWHRGLATEAGLAVRRYAFESLALPHVISLVRPVNLPSQAVARRLGMVPLREAVFRGIPHLVFSVARHEVGRVA